MTFVRIDGRFLVEEVTRDFFNVDDCLVRLSSAEVLLVRGVLRRDVADAGVLDDVRLASVGLVGEVTLVDAVFPVCPDAVLLRRAAYAGRDLGVEFVDVRIFRVRLRLRALNGTYPTVRATSRRAIGGAWE